MQKEIIYIKYDYFDRDSVQDFLYEIEKVFSEYPWGAGFRTENFRYDQSYFYCDMISEYYVPDDYGTYQQTESYIQGMISGYLLAKGVEIR